MIDNNLPILTVFTPTYNRAYCLGQCYESLRRQSNKNFIWLIIDDGSSDETKKLVESWQFQSDVKIQYHYQKNQGMHGGHNAAYDLIKTELNVCIDSDDFMPDDAVEKIINFWNQSEKRDSIAGFIGLDAYKDGKVIGDKMPEDIKYTTLEELHHRHDVTGDKKLVFRTDVVKSYPRYPIFEEERFVPLGTLYLLVDKRFQMLCLNEVLCIVEYMEDGSSRNIIKQYYRHPKGFQYARLVALKHSNYLKIKFKNAVHYISHSIQLRDGKFLHKTPQLFLTILAIPFGLLLHLYILYVNFYKK